MMVATQEEVRGRRQQWSEDVAHEAESHWQCGLTYASEQTVIGWNCYDGEMRPRFIAAVNGYVQELWENWGTP